MDFRRVLFTGGTGLLGGRMKKLIPDALFVGSGDFNVTDYDQMCGYLESKNIEVIFHAAAFTSPPRIDKDPARAIDVNIIGTCNLVKICMERDIKLIYMCTDYVFKGDKGLYKEDDPVFPVNKYAWSKLGGECAVRLYDNSLIIRTSFGAVPFPYEKAFVDQWTSRLPVDEAARKIVKVMESGLTGTIHVGGGRQTVFEYARSVSPEKDIGKLALSDVPFAAPKDTSLDASRYDSLVDPK